MRRILLFLQLGLVLLPLFGNAQGYENIWFIGGGQSMNFSTGSPVPGGIPDFLNQYYSLNNGTPPRATIAVSDNNGDLQFFCQYFAAQAYPQLLLNPKVFDRNGNPFSNGAINAYAIEGGGNPLVIPSSINDKRYYLFYVKNGSLQYSIVDMSLNNGLGDVDVNYKDIMLKGYGTVNGMKMTAVQSCSGVWLVVRSRTANEYFSFKVDENGVNATPVVSVLGALPLFEYMVSLPFYGGLLKASNNGRYLVAATNMGVEMYDFERCSGKLKSARLIDTMQSYGVCFSSDDSKLYVSHNKKWQIFYQGEVFQYDLNQPDLQSITASKNLVMRNPIYENTSFSLPHITGAFGDLKSGPDGKIYIGNNTAHPVSNPSPCWLFSPGPANNAVPMPNNTDCITSQFLHVIHDPNQAGTACSAELTYLEFPGSNNNVTGLLLQNDIVAAPTAAPDTVSGNVFDVIVCFSDSETLSANEGGSCYLWDDGSTEMDRVVDGSGTYWVGYFQDCTYRTDTFFVQFIPLPEVNAQYFGCEDEIRFTVKATDGLAYGYILRNEDNEIVGEANGFGDAVFQDLNSGNYALQITAQGVCDTTLLITLNAYPAAEVQVYPEVATIAYGDSIQLNATGADLYHWWPSGSLDSAVIANPWARPFEPTVFTVLGINRYGCRDSAFVNIKIDYTMPDLIPNAFSPNGDGLNDVFRIEGIAYQKVLVFDVFNRYGQRVFSTTKSDVGWDGRFKGKDCGVGIYYYLVRLVYPDGRERVLKGDVQLIR